MPRGKFSVTGETTLLAKIAGDFKDYEWIYRFGANPGMPRGGVLPPTPVWAPEPALGSRPRVALSSAQAGAMYCRPGPGVVPRKAIKVHFFLPHARPVSVKSGIDGGPRRSTEVVLNEQSLPVAWWSHDERE